MPYKDSEVRKIYGRHYMRKRWLKMSQEGKEKIRKRGREHKRDILASLTPEQKAIFYKNMHKSQYKRNAWRYAEAHRKLREQALQYLGGKCANPVCGWANTDGSLGCSDFRCLQIDHVNGDGVKDRRKTGVSSVFLRKVLRDTSGMYQLLCANCNWIKRVENKEYMKSIHFAPKQGVV